MNFTYRSFWACLCISLMLAAVMAPVGAAAIVWEGDESTLYSTAGNWTGGSTPGTGDTPTFNATASGSCSLDVVVSVAAWDMSSGAFTHNLLTNPALACTVSGNVVFDAASDADTIAIRNHWVIDADATFLVNDGPRYVFDTTAIYDLRGNDSLINNATAYRLYGGLFAAYADKKTIFAGTGPFGFRKNITYGSGTAGGTASKHVNHQLTPSTVISIDPDFTFEGASAATTFTFEFVENCDATIPSIYDCNCIVYIQNEANGGTQTANLGVINCSHMRFENAATAETGIFVINCDSNITMSGDYKSMWGSSGNAGKTTINLNNGMTLSAVGKIESTTWDDDTLSVNMGTATLELSDTLALGSKTKLVSGTSDIDFEGSGVMVLDVSSSTNQDVYDLTHSGSGSLYIQSSNSSRLVIDGDFARTGAGALYLSCGLDYGGDVLIDGAGNVTGPEDTIKNTGGGTLHIGSVGTISTASTILNFDAAGAVLDKDKQATFRQILVSSTGEITSSGSAAGTYYNSTGPAIVIADGGEYTQNVSGEIYRTGSDCDAYSIHSGGVFDGSGNVVFEIPGVWSANVPAMEYTGTGQVKFEDAASANIPVWNQTGNISAPNGRFVFRRAQATNITTYNQNRHSITAKDMDIGCSNATGTFIGNFNGSIDLTRALNTTGLNSGTTTVYDTADWSVGTNFTWQTTHNHYPATGQSLTMAGTGNLTSAGKFSPDSICINGGNVTAVDALSVTGNLTVIAGNLTTNANLTVGGDFAFADTVNISGDTLTVGGDFTASGDARIDRDTDSYIHLTGTNITVTVSPLDGDTLPHIRADGDSVSWQ